MKTNVSFAILIGLMLIELPSKADDEWKPSGYLSVSLQERYIAARISRTLHDGWSLWSELNVDLPKGFYINIWDHYGLDGRAASNQPDELDFNLGWKKKWDNGVDIGCATSYFNNSPLDMWYTGDVLIESVWVSKTYRFGNHSLRPQARLDWIAKVKDFGRGAYIAMPNIGHAWQKPFGLTKLTFAEQAFIIHDDGFDGARNDSEGIFFRWNASLNWSLNKKVTIMLPGFSHQHLLCGGNDGRGSASGWSTAISFKF